MIWSLDMKVVDLFSGCGGLSLGFLEAGFKIIAAFDNWEPAIRNYRKNFNHEIINMDLSTAYNYKKIADYTPDMIIGGPPCQDFSSAGKRNEDLGRGDLTIDFANIIKHIRPKYFLMENVDRILKSKKLAHAVEIFSANGYRVSFKVLDASFCGVPQIRKRFFMFGELNPSSNGDIAYYFDINKSKHRTTVRDYLGNDLGIEYYYRHPRNYNRRAIFSIDESSPTVRGVNRPVSKGYTGHPSDPVTINPAIRSLTTIERSWLQTFPKHFSWEGTKTDLEQMIGNAVPVKLAKFVAQCIRQYIDFNNSLTTNSPLIKPMTDLS